MLVPLMFLLCLQVTEAHSESVKDQEWLDHFKRILHQKVGLTDLILSPVIGSLCIKCYFCVRNGCHGFLSDPF